MSKVVYLQKDGATVAVVGRSEIRRLRKLGFIYVDINGQPTDGPVAQSSVSEASDDAPKSSGDQDAADNGAPEQAPSPEYRNWLNKQKNLVLREVGEGLDLEWPPATTSKQIVSDIMDALLAAASQGGD